MRSARSNGELCSQERASQLHGIFSDCNTLNALSCPFVGAQVDPISSLTSDRGNHEPSVTLGTFKI